MTVQHKDIPDAQRHEPKGASTATAGQALFSSGAGATEFRQIDFTDIGGTPTFSLSSVLEIESSSIVNQTTTANTEATVAFGAAVATDNVDLTVGGVLTFLTAGTYFITVDLAAALISGSGGSGVFIKEVLNGSLSGRVLRTKSPIQLTAVIEAGSGDTYEIKFIRSSVNWGLETASAPTHLTWNDDSASAVLRVYRFSGA